jgi:hypothetical protein
MKKYDLSRAVKIWLSILSLLLIFSHQIGFSQDSITYKTIYKADNFPEEVNLSLPVGSLSGKDVSGGNGAAAYAVEIECPKGTNGVAPNFSVTYGSNGVNGLLGWGWGISGLSAISRVGRDIHHDGFVCSPTKTNLDKFVIDGMRINPILGLNGENNTEYETEQISYSKVISYGTSGDGPSYFTVTTKDGTVLEYGNSNTSKVTYENLNTVMQWRLNKRTDVNGNYIEYKYSGNYRDFRIDEINYTGNTNMNLLPYNNIKFNYKVREELNNYYDGGGKNSINLFVR